MKVKLVAIAKDEAAYLSEWIYHHLVFGFTSIEVYLNNTSDNSVDLLSNISKNHPVKIIEADDLYEKHGTGFQKAAYLDAYYRSKNDGTTYLMFLDIDEFWTPLDFKKDIKTFLIEMKYPDVISFEWCFPNNENNIFDRPYKASNKLIKNYHVKSIFSMQAKIDDISVHNVISNEANFLLADGSQFVSDEAHKYMVSLDELKKDIYRPFILHRVTRSQIEYISLLGRGRPSTKMKIKDNRWGFVSTQDEHATFTISEDSVLLYNRNYASFIQHSDIESDIVKGRSFIIERFKQIITYIYSSQDEDHLTFQKVLKDITLESVLFSLHAKEASCLDINDAKKQYGHLITSIVASFSHDEINKLISELASIDCSYENKQSIPYYSGFKTITQDL